jgi:hypothetical protein
MARLLTGWLSSMSKDVSREYVAQARAVADAIIREANKARGMVDAINKETSKK